jgi:hypothetical protein
LLRAKARSAFRLATDGNTDTACRLISQATSRSPASVSGMAADGFSVTNKWKGSAVSAPDGTIRRLRLSLTSASTGPSSVP